MFLSTGKPFRRIFNAIAKKITILTPLLKPTMRKDFTLPLLSLIWREVFT